MPHAPLALICLSSGLPLRRLRRCPYGCIPAGPSASVSATRHVGNSSGYAPLLSNANTHIFAGTAENGASPLLFRDGNSPDPRLTPLLVTRLGPSRLLFHDGDDMLGRGPRGEAEPPALAGPLAALDAPEEDSASTRLTVPLTGVYTTRLIRKFTPIQILPEALAVAQELVAARRSPRSASPASSDGWDIWDQQEAKSESIRNAERLIQSLSMGSGAAQTTSPSGVDGFEWTAEELQRLRATPLSPPYLSNRVTEPSKSVSLRRFLALRHCWYSPSYFHIPTDRGWYLLAPSWTGARAPQVAVRLPADHRGAAAWCQRLHPRYLPGAHTAEDGAEEETEQDEARDGVDGATCAPGTPVAPDTAALSSRLESFRTAKALELHAASPAAEWESRGPAGDDRASDAPAVPGKEKRKKKKSKRVALRDGAVLPYIRESHLFHLNDGVQWPIPPIWQALQKQKQGDVDVDAALSPSRLRGLMHFYAKHLERVEVYDENGGGWSASEEEDFINEALEAWRRGQEQVKRPLKLAGDENTDPVYCGDLPSEAEVLHFSRRLFRAYTRKANVQLVVDDAEEHTAPLLTLVPLTDLKPGTELVMHYGREWWTEHYLYPLLLLRDWETAAQQGHRGPSSLTLGGSGMKTAKEVPRDSAPLSVAAVARAAEQLTAAPTDAFEPFPVLHARRRRQRKSPQNEAKRADHPKRKEAEAEGGDAPGNTTVDQRSSYSLYNRATRTKASPAVVLAAALQRAVLRPPFFRRLVRGFTSSSPVEERVAVFDLSQPDAEVPLKQLRRALLKDLLLHRDEEGAAASAHGFPIPSLLPLPDVFRRWAPMTGDLSDAKEGVLLLEAMPPAPETSGSPAVTELPGDTHDESPFAASVDHFDDEFPSQVLSSTTEAAAAETNGSDGGEVFSV